MQKKADTGPQNLYFDSPEIVLVSSPEAAASHRPIKAEPGASSPFSPHFKREIVTPPSQQQQQGDTTIEIGSSPELPFVSPQASPGSFESKSKKSFLGRHLPTLEEIASPFRSSTSTTHSGRVTRQQAAEQNIQMGEVHSST